MARARSGSRGVKEWTGSAFTEVNLTTTQSIQLFFLETGSPSTILRIRGNILVKGTPDAVTDDDVVGLGMIVVSEASQSAGGASVPGPIDAPNSPWIWHTYVPLAAGQAALDGSDIGSMDRVEVDSKSMRKIGINERLCLIGELSTGLYGAVSVTGGVRVLVLHG